MRILPFVVLLAAAGACSRPAPLEEAAPRVTRFVYPPATRSDVVDVYHGVEVPDPYRWLEDPDTPEARSWIEAQNRITQAYLAEVPAREAVRARLERLWNHERFGVPQKRAGRYFFERNDGLQNQSVLYVADALEGEPRVLLDPNGLSPDGTVSVAGSALSEDGRLLAYALADGGSDWRTWKVRDVATGEDLPDEVRWSKFSGASWTHDGKGFYYSRYDEPTKALQGVNQYQKLYYHRLGTPQSEDVLVIEDRENPLRGFSGQVTEDGTLLLIHVWEGTERKNRLYVQDLTRKGAPVVRLLDTFDAYYGVVAKIGRKLVVQTSKDAPRQRVIEIDLDKPDPRHWRELVPEAEETLDHVSYVGGRLVATYLKDARTVVRLFERDGKPAGEVALPGLGTAVGFGGRSNDPETFFHFSSFTDPGTIFRYDVRSGQTSPFRRPEVAFDPDRYETKQVFYESRDGTRIPMFLVHRKDLALDGTNPTLLYGYGGFNISLTPSFALSRIVWLEMGGVYAVANLRGGGEYGRDWHQQGVLDRKQNVFDDFAAAARWLKDTGYTSTEKLAIHGGSNGGLLVGATITQNPGLVGAALPAVGVLDMLRYHEFTIGRAWASDYGTVEDPEMFPVLRGYSPYHNVREGVSYPATLVTTGDHDDRVVPAHSFKFAAALQHAQAGDAPVLIRVETRAGHGAGKPTRMKIDEIADQYAFLIRALDVSLPEDFGR